MADLGKGSFFISHKVIFAAKSLRRAGNRFGRLGIRNRSSRRDHHSFVFPRLNPFREWRQWAEEGGAFALFSS